MEKKKKRLIILSIIAGALIFIMKFFVKIISQAINISSFGLGKFINGNGL